ncbi:MAG: ATP-binding protein [Cyclobacteriaceae bacterium]
MVYNSKGLAVLLSGCIAFVVTLFLFLFEKLGSDALIFTFLISFVIAFLFIFSALEFLIFREIKKIRKVINKLGGKEFQGSQKSFSLNQLQTITEDIRSFVAQKQEEIDRLKNLEAFRKDFIANVSHELKTPIFAAQGFVHTLIDGVKEKDVRKKFLKKAAKSLDGLDMLVQDLLMLSQIETGQIKMRFDEVDLYALTDEVLEQFRGKSNKKEVALRMEGPVRKVMAIADGQRISQVMTNLISNAIKHSFEEGEIVVSFTEKKKSVITRVRDFGEGIPEDQINRIFERFYRVDKSRSREKGGTGLGLAIVKHILDGHQSKAEVESVPGKGSTFSFKLPTVENEEPDDGEDHETAKD